jgi:C-terminal processing protease CtpA/Prc
MLLAVGPILGEGDVGAFVDAEGHRQVWAYRQGQALLDGRALAQGPAYQLKRPLPPVAVLTGPRTASAGEAIAVAFRGRPRARSFGEPTAGLPTIIRGQVLSDGAWLLLTEVRDADRTGRTYEDTIAPDEPVAVEGDPPEWQLRDPERDPVLRAALAWLRDQPDCAGQEQGLFQPG